MRGQSHAASYGRGARVRPGDLVLWEREGIKDRREGAGEGISKSVGKISERGGRDRMGYQEYRRGEEDWRGRRLEGCEGRIVGEVLGDLEGRSWLGEEQVVKKGRSRFGLLVK